MRWGYIGVLSELKCRYRFSVYFDMPLVMRQVIIKQLFTVNVYCHCLINIICLILVTFLYEYLVRRI